MASDLSDFSVDAAADYAGTVEHELWCNRNGCEGTDIFLTLKNSQDLPAIIEAAESHAKKFHGE